ncbi:MAG: hypothetical protein IIT46_03480 [Lachnospiraceae bacterium]|nr:hypothetical protein [Lachnospiraceae bacterium]
MVRIEKVNGKNVWDLLKLKVSDEQRSFVAGNDTVIDIQKGITDERLYDCGALDKLLHRCFCEVSF